MKRLINKAVGPVCALGAGIGVASCIWLALYTITNPNEAWTLIVLLLGASVLMLAGWVGVRFFPKQHIWPGACMVVSAPVCVWCGVAGPGALLGVSYGIIGDALDGYSLEPLEYMTMPGMVAAIVCAVAFGLVGLAWLAVDIYGMASGQEDWMPDTKARRADRYYGGPRSHAPEATPAPGRTAPPVAPARRPATPPPRPVAPPAQSTAGSPGGEYSLEPFENIGYENEAAPAPEGIPANAGSTRVMTSTRPRPAGTPPAPAAGQPGQAPAPYTRERTPYSAQGKKPSGGLLGGLGDKLFSKNPPPKAPPASAQAAPTAYRAGDAQRQPPAPPAPEPAAQRPLAPNPYADAPQQPGPSENP